MYLFISYCNGQDDGKVGNQITQPSREKWRDAEFFEHKGYKESTKEEEERHEKDRFLRLVFQPVENFVQRFIHLDCNYHELAIIIMMRSLQEFNNLHPLVLRLKTDPNLSQYRR